MARTLALSPGNALNLRVVMATQLFTHESADPGRVERLAARLETDQRLINPLVVVRAGNRFMVLDGATRTAALQALEVPHVIVQVTSEENDLRLHTWHHRVHGIKVAHLLPLLDGLPNVTLLKSDSNPVDDMFEYGGLCTLHTADGQTFVVQPSPGANRLDALNALVEAYLHAAQVSRTLSPEWPHRDHAEPDLAALVVFPTYTVEQVIQVALAGKRFPAGITRFVVPGRVLHLNVALERLRSEQPIEEKARWLNEQVAERIGRGRVRYYEEPVYLMDE